MPNSVSSERVGDPRLYEILQELHIAFDYHEHPPAPTVEIAMEYWKNIPGTHCKNLFMRNHKGNRHFLIIAPGENTVNIHGLEQMLKQGKLSFASEHRMKRYLGVEPGSVSPFGLINDAEQEVELFLDKELKMAERLSFHPNDNRASLVIGGEDFFRFLTARGNRYTFLDLANPQ